MATQQQPPMDPTAVLSGPSVVRQGIRPKLQTVVEAAEHWGLEGQQLRAHAYLEAGSWKAAESRTLAGLEKKLTGSMNLR